MRIAVMQEQRAGGKSHDAEDAIQSLREHALNFAADEAGSREVEIGKGQHVALDASLLFFVESHDHDHGDEGARGGSKDAHIGPLKLGSGVKKMKRKPQHSPGGKRETEKAVGQGFLAATFLKKDAGNGDVEERSGNDRGDRKQIEGIGAGPQTEDKGGDESPNLPRLSLGVDLRAEEKEQSGNGVEPVSDRDIARIRESCVATGGSEVMDAKNKPCSSPIEQVSLALETVDVGEKAGYEKRSGEKRQRYKALMHPDQSQLSNKTTDAIVRNTKAPIAFVL